MVIKNSCHIFGKKYGDVMIINLNYMKNEIEKLNALIDEYEENSINLKNSFKSVSFFWNGNLMQKYMDDVNNELKKLDLTILNLESIKDIYNYIIEQYSFIGRKIEFDNSFKVKVFTYFDTIINDYDNILQKYNLVNYSLDSQLTTIIEKERVTLLNNKNSIINYVSDLKNIYNKLEEVEKNIKQRIYKLNLEKIEL